MLDALAAHQSLLLHQCLGEAEISEHQLWWYYYGLGGVVGEVEVDAYLHQALHLPRFQRNLLDHAGHELITY
jgi:hypothetical protein